MSRITGKRPGYAIARKFANQRYRRIHVRFGQLPTSLLWQTERRVCDEQRQFPGNYKTALCTAEAL